MFSHTQIKKIYILLLMLMALISPVKAITLVDTPTTITSGNHVEYTFNSLNNDPQYIKVYLKSRYPSTGFDGSTYGVYIEINGKPVNAAVSRTIGRLLNDSLTSPVIAGIPAPWFYPNFGWRAIYAPSYNTYPGFYTHNPYILELDVSDLINTTTNNVIRVTNKNPVCSLEINTLQIITYNYYNTSPTLAAAASLTPYVNTGESAAGPAAYTYSVKAGGGFTVTIKEHTWAFGTDLSYPNTEGKYDKLVPLDTPDGSGESFSVVKTGNTINAWGATFAITRNFEFTTNKITVTDVLLNMTSTAQALILDHHVDLSDITNPPVYLAGNVDPSIINYSSSGNPSVFIAASDHGLGMLYEDDISRAHAKLYFSPEPTHDTPPATYSAGLRDQMLCIPANSTYTNVWSIYPVNSVSYYDFVNMVRQDWGANFTIDGGYCLFEPRTLINNYTVAQIAAYFDSTKAKYAFVTGGLFDPSDPVHVGFGMAIADNNWISYRACIRDANTILNLAKPEVKLGIYYNSQRDTSLYTYTTANKRTLSDNSVSTTNFCGENPITTNMVATSTNTFGSDLLDLLNNTIMSSGTDPKLGLDGIYWDEVEGIEYGSPLVTYNMEDGNSCEIDMNNFTISRQYGVVPLLSKQHNLNTIAAIKNNGGIVIGNGPALSKDILATHMPRFSESLHDGKVYEFESHISTPLGFMVECIGFSSFITVIKRGCIPIWQFWNSTEYPFIKYLWPLTVMEMHSGYFLAQERIITTHAGTYGWRGGNSLVQIYRFNTSGVQQGTVSYPTTIPGITTVISSLTDGEAVVLERIPVTIDVRP